MSLPPANEVWGKVIFQHLFVILFTGGSTWAGAPPAGTPPGRYTSLGRYTPWAGTPPGTRYTPGPGTPPDQVHPPGPGTPQDQVHPPGTRYTPPGRYTPWGQVHPPDQVPPLGPGTLPRPGTPPQEQCMLGDKGNKRTVRILLECILLVFHFDLKS